MNTLPCNILKSEIYTLSFMAKDVDAQKDVSSLQKIQISLIIQLMKTGILTTKGSL